MSVYKITIGFGQTVMGATESFYTPDASDSIIAARINELLLARNQLLWDIQYWTGVRVSLYGSKRRSQAYLPGATPFKDSGATLKVPDTGLRLSQSLAGRPDQFRAVLQWLAHYDVDRTAIRYLSGVSDAITATEPGTVDPTGNTDWFTDWQKFTATLVNRGWQIRARLTSGGYAPASVKGVVSQVAAPHFLGIKIVSMGAPPIADGDKIALAKFRPAKGVRASTINGTWYVESLDTGTYPGFTIVYLRGSEDIDPTAQRFTDLTTLQLVGYGLFPITQAYYNRAGIHKRGRPLLAPRGRRLVRPSLGF